MSGQAIFDFTIKGSISQSSVSGASKSLPGMIATPEGQVKTGITFRSLIYLGSSQFEKKKESFLKGIPHRVLNILTCRQNYKRKIQAK